MRLTEHQITTIKTLTTQVFGQDTAVYLFGSRTDDNLKGGDIDLYIIPTNKEQLLEKRLTLNSQLQMQLGEQKIDIVIAQDSNRPIEQQAIKAGIKL